MIAFNILDDADPALVHSPILRGLQGIIAFLREHGEIGLTQSGAFNREFVAWAAAELGWSGDSEVERPIMSKGFNKDGLPPLADLHVALLALGLGYHDKGRFTLASTAETIADRPGHLFGIMAPYFLLEIDHAERMRRGKRLFQNWPVWLNAINVEAEDGATGLTLRRKLYGEPQTKRAQDELLSDLHCQVLQPLCWIGLIFCQPDGGSCFAEKVYYKTPLWHAALTLHTDRDVKRQPRH